MTREIAATCPPAWPMPPDTLNQPAQPVAALADGTSRYVVPRQTEHLDSNLWLVAQFGARGECRGREVTIEGLGLHR